MSDGAGRTCRGEDRAAPTAASTWSWRRPASGGSTGRCRADHLELRRPRRASCSASTRATFDHRVASFWATLHPEDRPGVEAAVAAALDACGGVPGGVPRPCCRTARCAGSRPAAGSWPVPTALAERMLGVARDTSDQRLARDTVARALEHMADGFLSVDDDWSVTYATGTPRCSSGRRRRRSGRTLWEVWPHLHLRLPGRWCARPPRPGRPARVRQVRRGARGRGTRIRVVPHQDGLSLFATDVTAARAAELERERAITRPDQARAVLAYSAALAEADSVADVIERRRHDGAAGVRRRPGCSCRSSSRNRLKLSGHCRLPAGRRAEMLGVLSADDDQPDRPQVLRTREPLFLPSRGAYLGCSRAARQLLDATRKQAWAFLPLTVSGRALGSLTISFDRGPRLRAGRAVAAGQRRRPARPDPGPGAAARRRAHPGRRAAAAAAAPRAAAADRARRHRALPRRDRRDGRRRRLVRRAGAAGATGARS